MMMKEESQRDFREREIDSFFFFVYPEPPLFFVLTIEKQPFILLQRPVGMGSERERAGEKN